MISFVDYLPHSIAVNLLQEACSSTHQCATPDVRTTTYTWNDGAPGSADVEVGLVPLL